VAFQISLMAISVLGYIGMLILLRRGPNAPWLIAIPASLVFAFPNQLYVASNHPQLLTLVLLPWLLLLLLNVYRSTTLIGAVGWGIGFGLLSGLILLSAFYVFWFWAVSLPVAMVTALIPRGLRQVIIARRRILGMGLVTAAIGLVPSILLFFRVYAEAITVGANQRGLYDPILHSLSPRDYINVSSFNLVWGNLIDRIYSPDLAWRHGISEWSLAVTPGVLVVSGVTLVLLFLHLRRLNAWQGIALSLLLTGFITLVAPLRIGPIFPWQLLFEIPGGSAIRAIGRFELVSGSFLVLGVAIAFAQWRRWWGGTRIRVVGGLLLAGFLIVEQVNVANQHNNPRDRLASFTAKSPPPAECRSFMMTTPFNINDFFTLQQLDAMTVSYEIGLPTLNGWSGLYATDWNLTTMNEAETLARNARYWIDKYRLENVCGIDFNTHTWLNPQQLNEWISRQVDDSPNPE
jgi:hypothetical protein